MEQPQAGRAYPLVLAPGFDHPARGERSGELCTLRLDFIPASANREAEGTFSVDKEANEARLLVPSGAEGATAPVHFHGKFESTAEGTEYVATFDGTSFRLERLDAAATLRHAPGAAREVAAQRVAALNAAATQPSKAKKRQKTAPKAAAPAEPPAELPEPPAEEPLTEEPPAEEPPAEEPPAEAEPEVPSGPMNALEESFFGGIE